ncbi:MAG: hypothetical protein E7057_09400 [Lentisphaerae bacterium]|nr:hypothetical protein [Lentisphaerota bacterium]MBE6359442.1 hypothetical protein [Lentisphaerota bacterium]
MEMLAKFIRMRTARSAATASHPCVERPTEGINQYQEQSFSQKEKPRRKLLPGVFFAYFLFVKEGRVFRFSCCCPEFCKKSNLRWRLAGNLAPCSCAGAVEYIVHSCPVLIAKHDLPPQSIHRLDQTRTGLVDKSQLM